MLGLHISEVIGLLDKLLRFSVVSCVTCEET